MGMARSLRRWVPMSPAHSLFPCLCAAAEVLLEEREKELGIEPDPAVAVYMHALSKAGHQARKKARPHLPGAAGATATPLPRRLPDLRLLLPPLLSLRPSLPRLLSRQKLPQRLLLSQLLRPLQNLRQPHCRLFW